MIYFDASALVKLVRAEEFSPALQAWIEQRADELQVTSALSRAEVLRAVRRANHTGSGELIDPAALDVELAAAAEVLAAVGQITVDDRVLDRAGAIDSPMIRTLDAVHLASAAEFELSELVLVTYDRRLAVVAENLGIKVVAPGPVSAG